MLDRQQFDKKQHKQEKEFDISGVDQSVFDDPIKLLDYLDAIERQGKQASNSPESVLRETQQNEEEVPQILYSNSMQKKDLYGYCRIRGVIAINGNEAKIIRTTIELFDKGMNFNAISDRLNKNGYKTRFGKKIYPGFVQSIISARRSYEGEHGYPPILKQEVSKDINIGVEKNTKINRVTKVDSIKDAAQIAKKRLQYCNLEKAYIEESLCKKIQKTVDGIILPTKETEEYLDIPNNIQICQKCDYSEREDIEVALIKALKRKTTPSTIQLLKDSESGLKNYDNNSIISTLNKLCREGKVIRSTVNSPSNGIIISYSYNKEKKNASKINKPVQNPIGHNQSVKNSQYRSFAEYVAAKKTCCNCGKPMKLCRSKKGPFFLGCSQYPNCKNFEGIDPQFVNDYLFLDREYGTICPIDNTTILARLGKYGVYVCCSCGGQKHFSSLDKI